MRKQPRSAARRMERRMIDPRNGLIRVREYEDGQGDTLIEYHFENGEIEVWRQWDAPQELRLIRQRHADGTTVEYWAEGEGEEEGS